MAMYSKVKVIETSIFAKKYSNLKRYYFIFAGLLLPRRLVLCLDTLKLLVGLMEK